MKMIHSNHSFYHSMNMPAMNSKKILSQSYKFTTSHDVYKENFNTSKIDLMNKNCFWNQCFDKSRLKNFVLWFLLNHGEHKTVQLVEQLKTLGFKHATRAGISLGIEDLKIPPKKNELIFEAEKLTLLTVNEYKRGEITGVERFQRLIDTWHRTSERLKQEVIDHFESTDILNPVYMMAFSGARGNISQVRQLVGMRGLMANPQGQIIDFPIRSNFREGLTLTEYIISSYGARKGIVDTALRTANAGYLTRRLVDVAQHVIISNFDCETRRGIFLTEMKEGNKTIYSLQNRLVGRVLARNLYRLIPDVRKSLKNGDQKQLNGFKVNKEDFSLLAKRNTEISLDLAFEIAKSHKKIFVRSSLTCESKKLVCQLCYGWSLAQGNLVSIGEAVGVVAAQSIGEPGTQLTMRTFHTGGVFSGDVSDQIKAPFNGYIEYEQPIAGTLIRTPEGKIGFLTKNEGSFFVYKMVNPEFENFSAIKDTTVKSKKYKIPPYTLVFKRMGEFVFEKEVIAQISSISRQKNSTDDAELTIKSEMEGQFYSKVLDLKENKIGPKPKKDETELFDSLNSYTTNSLTSSNDGVLDKVYEAWNWGYAWILSGKIYQLSFPSSFFPKIGDFVNRNTIMNQIQWKFYSEAIGNVMTLQQPLTFSYSSSRESNLVNGSRKLTPFKHKNLMVSYFNHKNSTLNPFHSQKDGKFFTTPVLNSTSQPKPSIELSNASVGGRNLENALNIPVVANSVLSFDIHSIFYKKNAYLMKLKHLPFFRKSSSSLLNSSILSNNDILSVVTSLERPQNGTSIFATLSMKKMKIVNKELNTLTNISNSLATSNWLPNSNYFLNWYPNHSQLQSPGLIALETVFPSHAMINFEKQKNKKIKAQKANLTNALTNESLNREKNYKLQFESKFQKTLNQSIRLKNLDFNTNLSLGSKKLSQKSSRKRIKILKQKMNATIKPNPFVSSVIKKEFVTKFLKDDPKFKNLNSFAETKNLIMSLSKSKVKENFVDSAKSSFIDPSPKKKQIMNKIGEKLFFSQSYSTDSNLNNLYFTLRWKNSYFCQQKVNLESNQKRRQPFFNKENINLVKNLIANEKTLNRIFMVPQFFYQLNSTFSTLLTKNMFFHSKDPIFYQINKQGHLKYVYLSKSFANLLYSFHVKQFLENEKSSEIFKKNDFIPNMSIQLNQNLLLKSLKKFCHQKKEDHSKHKLTTSLLKSKHSIKQIYNLNQFKNLKTRWLQNQSLQNIDLKKYKLFKEFKDVKEDLNHFKLIPSNFSQNKSFIFNKHGSMLQFSGSPQIVQNQTHLNQKTHSHKIEKNSYVLNVRHLTKKGKLYVSRLLSFSTCQSLKAFSKKLMYLSVLTPKSKVNSEKNRLKVKKSLKNYQNLSLFNFCMLSLYGVLNHSIYRSNANLKISNKIFMSNFITSHFASQKMLNQGHEMKQLSNVVDLKFKTYKALCTNHDLKNVSKNILFKTKRLNLVKFFLYKSIYNLEKKSHFRIFYSKKIQRHRFLKLKKLMKRSMKKNFNVQSLEKNKSIHLSKCPIQIKSGWVYLSPKLMNHFDLDKKFIFPGQILLNDFLIDHQISFLEFISLNTEALLSQPKTFKMSLNNGIPFSNLSYSLKNHISSIKRSKSQVIHQPIKTNLISKTFKTWNWVSNKSSRYVPSFFQGVENEIKYSFKDLQKYGLLIRNAQEHKQYSLNTYKFEMYNLSNQQGIFVPKLNQLLSKQNQMQALEKFWKPYCSMFENNSFQKMFGVLNMKRSNIVKKLSHQPIILNRTFLKQNTSIQMKNILNITKKFLSKKRIFVNNALNSIMLQNEFRNSLQNKQKRNLQILSKFPTIDLELKLNNPLSFVHEPSTLNSDGVNKIKVNQEFKSSKMFQTKFPNSKSNLDANILSQLVLILNSRKKMLPCISRKSINFAPLIVSYKIPYGFHNLFNTDFSLFNYKNHLTYHFQTFTNSFYLTKFLDHYIQKSYRLVNQKEETLNTALNAKSFFQENKFNVSEINLIIPAFFSCPYFSYHLIQKFDKTFIPNFNALNLGLREAYPIENSSSNQLEKLRLLSKKIEIKNQFFTSKMNRFRSSDSIGKTSSYSAFDGEMIYKKDLTNLKNAFFMSSKRKNKLEKSIDSVFPSSNSYSALILTKQDLIAFSFEKNNSSLKIDASTSFGKITEKTTSQLTFSKKQYYVNDMLIKFQKMNSINLDDPTMDHDKTLVSNNNSMTMDSIIKINKLSVGLPIQKNNLVLGEFFMYGDRLKNNLAIFETGQIIHIGQKKVTLRRGQPIFVSPKAILHKYDGDFIEPQSSVITLAYSQLKTGDIIQGIPKVEQFFEARTTKRGRLFRDSLTNLLKGLFKRYALKYPLEKAVRQSFYKIQQIIVDGVQRVYRAQGAGIADKHLEIIVKQMTSKVRITQGGQTGFFAGEVVDLDLVEQVNALLMKKVQYEPLVLGITKASLEVDSFLSAASFQQTTRVLSKAAVSRKKDFLKGLKENVILGNLIPAGTGYLVSLEK